MAAAAAAAPEALAVASSSVTMLWGGVPLPATPPRMRCHVLVICAFADHCMPSVLVLGVIPLRWPGQGLSTVRVSYAALPCFCRAGGCLDSWDSYHGLCSVPALRFRWPRWPCASPGLCGPCVAALLSLLRFTSSAGTAACWPLALPRVVGSTSRHTFGGPCRRVAALGSRRL